MTVVKYWVIINVKDTITTINVSLAVAVENNNLVVLHIFYNAFIIC